ncbi:WD40 repeat [Nonomuraea solani]|uniref:WD40 repeat n=1 Tax=Nonomuraea solani TaxID=1144553 RepID=A0A1H6EUB5_9ACTN|nr:helix-turn-helix domain-containing protein [Nonomuraea solani]SEH00691.1 WD40 repeat [Nonomuraea solani]
MADEWTRSGRTIIERVATRNGFARALTTLRERAGLTVRDVARGAGIPDSTAGDYFGGAHLPPATQPDVLIRILKVCGVNEPAVVELWLERLAEVRRAPGRRPAGAPSPYRGLESFQAEHAGWFHGRDRVVRHLVRELRARASGTTGPLVAVGPSGSGKSSVLRAGLIPALRRGELGEGSATWPVILLTPGTHPLHTLTAGLTPLVPDGGGDAEALLTRAGAGDGRLVIVVDQFEEIFTACADHGERRAFADALCAAADQKGGALVVLGVRADFYPHVLRFPRLARAMQEGQVVIGPMTEDELREVIVGPARKARLDIEDGLVELLLRDLRPLTAEGGTGAAHDAGALPLLSYALLATWQRSRGRRLTVPDYRGCGGISGAVADTAELAYAELTPAQRSLARRIFIRLVHVADDMADSRRRLTLERLLSDTGHTASEELQDVLDTFVERRLITVGSDAVEITHEALIHAWPRLRAWIDADRAGLIVAQQFADAALAWQREGRDPASLYRGARLAAVREWADSGHRDELSSSTRDFLAASIGLEEEGLRVARRRTRRLRSLVAVLATLVLLTVTATGLALRGQRTLTEERDMAVSRQLAADADRLRGSDPGLAAQIALTAYRVAPTVEARSSLLSAYGGPSVTRLLGPAGVPRRMAFSSDGRLMATADATLRLWRIPPGSGAAVALGAPVATEPSRTLVFSPDGRTLAAFAEAGTVRLWDVADPARPAPISAPITSPGGAAPAYSPDGRILAAGGSNGTVTVYDVADPRRPRRLGAPLTGHSGTVQTVVFSPDGRLLAAGSADHTVRLWDLTDPARPVRVGAPISGSSSVLHLTFAPGGATLAVAASGEEKTVRLYDVTRPGRPARLGAPIEGPAGLVNFADFSPDGKTLAVASSDNKAWVWDLATRRTIALLPHPAPVAEARFLDANRLITTAEDGTTRLWTLPGPLITDPKDTVFTAAIGTDGRHLLVGADGSDETVRLYDIADPRRPAPLGPPMSVPTGLGLSGAAAQRPGGGLVAAGTLDGPVHLFDVRDPRPADPAGTPADRRESQHRVGGLRPRRPHRGRGQ